MKVLSFESSAKSASVALTEDGKLLAQYFQNTGLTHSRTLLPMAEDLLKNTELEMKNIDLFAVSHGPGSFTGIRIGISTVKGLAWSLEKPCVGVSTLEAMAWNGISHNGLLVCAMDARRNQIYNALFEVQDGTPCRLCEDRAISLDDLKDELKNRGAVPLILGDGAQITYDYLKNQNIPCILSPENMRWQNAWGVSMAAQNKESYPSEKLLPVYLRLSQAERERQQRNNSK